MHSHTFKSVSRAQKIRSQSVLGPKQENPGNEDVRNEACDRNIRDPFHSWRSWPNILRFTFHSRRFPLELCSAPMRLTTVWAPFSLGFICACDVISLAGSFQGSHLGYDARCRSP